MRYTIEKHERYVVIEPLRDHLDGEAAAFLKGEFMLRNTAGQRNIVLDLQHVKDIDFEGVRIGLLAHRLCRAVGGIFVLVAVHENILKKLRMIHLDSYFLIVDSVEEAQDIVFGSEIQRELSDED